MVLMFHQIRDVWTLDKSFVTTTEHLTSITACIKQAAEEKKITMGNVSAVINHLKKE